MRRKFFLISFLVMLITMFSIGSILLVYFQNERLAFLDDQIRQTATAIIDSKLLDLKTYDYEEADNLISEELGPDRIGKFFIIRNNNGEILFQTQNIEILNVDLERRPQWITLKLPNYFLRAVNLDLPKVPGKTMQVGAIVDAKSMSWAYISKSAWMMGGAILILILLLTWILSAYLFAPIRGLSGYVLSLTKSLEAGGDLPEMPKALVKQGPTTPLSSKDEFQSLVAVIKGMIERIDANRKFLRSWSFQMAHELKTPLTILNRDIEILAETHGMPDKNKNEIQANINKLSETISGFLGWAETVSTRKVENLYAVHFERVWNQEFENFQKVYGLRLQLKHGEDFLVLSSPLHLEQVVRNILSNALKYSSKQVEVTFASQVLTVRDYGSGIPPQVLSRLGSPFNKGRSTGQREEGVGLGLAWVQTICDIYGWELSFQTEQGTEVRVHFKQVDF